MPQQINLCTPILLTQKRYFSAHTMALALGVFVVLGGALCGLWVWNLNQASESITQSLAAQKREVETLQAAIQRSRANAAPVNPALLALLQDRRNTLAQRERLKQALSEGVFRPGWGHSDRLTWVARSIPAPVWITSVSMDGSRFEVNGFTLEPSALNEWVDKLAASPLMQGLKLATVKVESATGAPGRLTWSFHLVSVEPPPSSPARLAQPAGGKL
jgi:Tfp pilus assembly protein PilN